MTKEPILAHEDSDKIRDYHFAKQSVLQVGKQAKTLCGKWLSICEDDPDYNPELWRYNRKDDRPTCPKCVESNPYGYPGMLLVITGAIGVPQIVRVTSDETWEGVFGFSKGREINPEGKTIHHVCQEDDIFEDIEMQVKDGEFVPLEKLMED